MSGDKYMFPSNLLARVAFFGSLALLASLGAHAQDSRFQLVEQSFNERFDDYGRVSGDIVMGVMIGSAKVADDMTRSADAAPRASSDLDVPLLSTQELLNATSRFCVRLNSKDGRFAAENTYRVTGVSEGISGLMAYEGMHSEQIRNLPAVSLIKVGRCGDRTEIVIPSAWAGHPTTSNNRALQIFVNSAGNPTAVKPGENADPQLCRDVADETTLKYTSLCVLPLETLVRYAENGMVRITFHVSRSLGEEKFNMSVIIPASGA